MFLEFLQRVFFDTGVYESSARLYLLSHFMEFLVLVKCFRISLHIASQPRHLIIPFASGLNGSATPTVAACPTGAAMPVQRRVLAQRRLDRCFAHLRFDHRCLDPRRLDPLDRSTLDPLDWSPTWSPRCAPRL